MVICSVIGCSNRPGKEFNGQTLSFFNFPKVIFNQGEETQKLCEERRRLWKAAICRQDLLTDADWERTIVCSSHFVDGKKAYLHSRDSPSWLPTLHLGHNKSRESCQSVVLTERYNRSLTRRKKLADTDISYKPKKPRHDLNEAQATVQDHSTDGHCNEQVQNDCKHASVQTDLDAKSLTAFLEDYQSRVAENAKEKSSVSIYERRCYVEDESKVSFYTGLPSLSVLDLVFSFIKDHLSNSKISLSKEQEFLMCLIKIRMNYLFQDMAYQLNVSVATITRSFHSTLDILVARLSFLIKWPSREALRMSMPMCFRENFGNKVAVIIDCFELGAHKPSGQANQIHIYSNYKHAHTAKYLIGITPQGSISFISDAFGGRASDKHIIENVDLLNNLLPGDVLMADRGFNIEDEVHFYQAKLAIPNFTHGKKQLHPMEVENTRKIASVRIHVERVIGRVRRKFGILQKEIPMDFMKNRDGDHNPTIDKIVRLCCCLVNLHKSIVPID